MKCADGIETRGAQPRDEACGEADEREERKRQACGGIAGRADPTMTPEHGQFELDVS